jgi:hypothetical protein
LWNVLKGEMSLVGPRPEDPEITAGWSDEVRREVLSVRPGITSPASVIYRNNISYASLEEYPAAFKACDYQYPSYVIQDHNTWVQTGHYFHTEANAAYTLSADDFVSLDTAQMRWPRKTDGSLPDIDFLKLNSNSDLINGGIDVGLAFYGPAPDLGTFQHGPFSVELVSPEVFREFTIGDPVVMQAKVEGLVEEIQEVVFYSEDMEKMLGKGNQISPSVWQFTWVADAIGYHKLRVVAVNLQDETATSSIVRIKIRWPLHASNDLSESQCKIIPNPNDGFFLLELPEPLEESSDIQIMSVTGQVMAFEHMARQEQIKEVDVSFLPPGLYYIRLNKGGTSLSGDQSLKMVKL